MTNFEKYKNEILAIINKGYELAMFNGILRECRGLNCDDCGFGRGSEGCNVNVMRWLYEESCPLKRGDRVIIAIPGQSPFRGYFAGRKEGNRVSVFSGGRDEWSSRGDTITYPEEYVKPYKEREETE